MDQEINRLLKRQLKKFPDVTSMGQEQLERFFSVVNETYFQIDRERRFLENALDVTSQELTGVNNRLKSFIENTPTGIAMLDNKLRYLFTSNRWLQERRLNELDVVGKGFYELSPDASNYWKEILELALVGQESSKEEEKIALSDGALCWIRWVVKPWFDSDGSIGGVIIFTEDITDRKISEEQFRIASVAFQANDGIIVSDVDGNVLRANDSILRLTGYAAEDLIGKNTSLLRSPSHHDASYYRNMWEAITTEGKWEGSIFNRHKDGHDISFWLSISAVRDTNGLITHFVAIYSNSSDPKEAEKKITELAYYDPLTNLPNRRLLLDRLNQARTMAKRNKIFGGVLLIDIDKFKAINDTRGHDVGDHVLVTVARRLRNNLREVDTAARLGGDEFLVLIPDLGTDLLQAENSLSVISNNLHLCISKPVIINGIEQRVTCSIGATLFSESTTEVNELLKDADLALYDAKSAGRNMIKYFTQGLHDEFVRKTSLENDLRLALDGGELALMFQPQVNSYGKVIGAEALLRWKSPGGEVISPDVFVPIAEESGLIVSIGEWVLRTACLQLAHWSNNATTKDLSLSVNISGRQFRQPDFAKSVGICVKESGINPKQLMLELTESLMLADVDEVISTMQHLREIGVKFSIDDFGTGYSSLSYLKRLPLDELKIDKSFVVDIATNDGDRAIVRTVFALSQALNLRVVAEGVETVEQRDWLVKEGCDCFQGYLYSKPLDANNFARFEVPQRLVSQGAG